MYVDAPAVEIVEDCPRQTAAGEADAVTTGFGFTVIRMDEVPVQPAVEVPVTL